MRTTRHVALPTCKPLGNFFPPGIPRNRAKPGEQGDLPHRGGYQRIQRVQWIPLGSSGIQRVQQLQGRSGRLANRIAIPTHAQIDSEFLALCQVGKSPGHMERKTAGRTDIDLSQQVRYRFPEIHVHLVNSCWQPRQLKELFAVSSKLITTDKASPEQLISTVPRQPRQARGAKLHASNVACAWFTPKSCM